VQEFCASVLEASIGRGAIQRAVDRERSDRQKEEEMQRVGGLAYEIHGEGQPVLLIHGSHVADSFLPLARETALADRHQLIRYHRRGFAGSAPHTGPFSIEAQAQDALALLEALGVAHAHVIGHSYGAVTALQLTCEAPSVVHSLVLLEPPKTTEPYDRFELFERLCRKYRFLANCSKLCVDSSRTYGIEKALKHTFATEPVNRLMRNGRTLRIYYIPYDLGTGNISRS
jgi:pimeloyl-ACP methyl ester carboxylesterase